MFQPARPLETWSSVEIKRANMYGGYSVMFNVVTMPSREVRCVSTDASTDGSCLGMCRLLRR